MLHKTGIRSPVKRKEDNGQAIYPNLPFSSYYYGTTLNTNGYLIPYSELDDPAEEAQKTEPAMD